MRLFDDRGHYDEESIRHGERLYDYLSRSARPDIARMRSTLEGWFSRYPASAQAEFWRSFRCGDDWRVRAAEFELCLHELLLRLGCLVRVHPQLKSVATHPDFEVRPPCGELFILGDR